MDWLAELLTTHLILFTLVLARVGGLVITAPLFAALAVPKNVRAIMAFALALLVAPTQIDLSAAAPATSIEWVLALAVELLLGLALGLGTAILVAGAQLAGQLIAQLSGLSLAEVFDPNLGAEVPLFSQLLGLFTVAVYLLIGGHRWLLAGLLDSFRALPVGGGAPAPGLAADAGLVDDRKLFFGHPRRRARPGGAIAGDGHLGAVESDVDAVERHVAGLRPQCAGGLRNAVAFVG